MGRTFSPKNILNYIIFGIVVLIGYKILFEDKENQGGRHNVRDAANRQFAAEDDIEDLAEHPRRLKPGGQRLEVREDEGQELSQEEIHAGIKDTVEEHKRKKHDPKVKEEAKDKKKVDVGDLPKDLEPPGDKHDKENAMREMGDLMHHREIRKGQKFFENMQAHGKGPNKKFLKDGIDWDLEEEMKKRRGTFQKAVEKMEEKVEDGDFKDMHESDDDFAFVTAGSHSTYPAAIEFIYSVQYFFPKSKIAIFDIGLTQDERDFINSLCNVNVESLWLQFWPEALYKIRHRVWRPLVLQLALAKYFHYIYLEPGRFVNKQDLRRYLSHSRKHGVTVAGRQLKYSSFVVTSPHMYTFLKTNERKLQRTPHFDFTLLILHNTNRVRNYFMRHLVACAMEDYCIAPPDSKASCDTNLANNKRYANCHRYDESAINLILNQWHNYKPEEFLVRDGITRHFDGRDLTDKVKVCNAN